MRIISGLLLFLLIPLSTIAQSHTISGFVKDAETGEVLIGANIFNKEKKDGATTNTYGFFSYTTASDSVKLTISYIGYKSIQLSFYLDKDIELDIKLIPGEVLEEVTVTAERGIENTVQMSRISIPIQQVQEMPQLLGEVDVLKSIQLLPGVQSGTEGSSGFYVRGGGPDQNLILLDGVPVYNAFHLFGFMSVFNADAINNVDLVKGGFPARYGGKLSSVLDITLKEGNTERIKGSGSVGIISSKFTLDGPINDKTTFLVSGRRTYADLFSKPILRIQSGGEKTSGYYFYDMNMKLNHQFSSTDRLFLSSYFGKDRGYAIGRYSDDSEADASSDWKFRREDDTDIEWRNFTTSLRWNHIFTPRLFSNVNLSISNYRLESNARDYRYYESDGEGFTSLEKESYFSGIDDLAAKMDFEFTPSPYYKLRFGSGITRHNFNPGVEQVATILESDTLGGERVYSNYFTGFLENEFMIGRRVQFNLGVHYSSFGVENTLYQSLEPRLAASYTFPSLFTLKGSYTEMTQYIHLLTNSGIGLPTDLWVPSTKNVEPQLASQLAFGVAKDFKDFQISVEGYYKEMENLIEYEAGANFLSAQESWEQKVVVGDGKSYGLEFLVQKKYGKWNGWIGYTISRNQRQFDDLNFGETFPYKYDRRHDVSIVAVYNKKKGVVYSANWVFGSGNTVTLPINRYTVIEDVKGNSLDEYINQFEGRNAYRMPPYHRLDISGSWTKEKRWGERTWSLGFYNAYSRLNPFYISLQTKDRFDKEIQGFVRERKFIQHSLFPIIPSISYSFKF